MKTKNKSKSKLETEGKKRVEATSHKDQNEDVDLKVASKINEYGLSQEDLKILEVLDILDPKSKDRDGPYEVTTEDLKLLYALKGKTFDI